MATDMLDWASLTGTPGLGKTYDGPRQTKYLAHIAFVVLRCVIYPGNTANNQKPDCLQEAYIRI